MDTPLLVFSTNNYPTLPIHLPIDMTGTGTTALRGRSFGNEIMKITIRERSYEYQSDYPDGWRFSSGDWYKFPVPFGVEQCFVKRFAKETSQVEGWELLTRLKGRYAGNTPRIHDMATVTEKGQTVHYVFYQYVEGDTLDRVRAAGHKVNLARLTNDLVAGLRVIHEHGFWFTDFTDKNIYCAKGGGFLLLDLDSAQPAAKRPTDAMYGDREYWSLVFDFYTREMQCPNFRAADLRGATLDYLQVPFLILRLHLYFTSKAQGEEGAYKSDAMRERLRTGLSQADPGFKVLFANALEREGRLFTSSEIEGLTQLIERRIIKVPAPPPDDPPFSPPVENIPVPPPVDLTVPQSDDPRVTPPVEDNPVLQPEEPLPVLPLNKTVPVIEAFGLTKREAERGELFAVCWKVAGADTVALYRNGKLLNTTAAGEGQLARSEFHAGDGAVHYHLVAYNEAGPVESNPEVLHCRQTPGDRTGQNPGVEDGQTPEKDPFGKGANGRAQGATGGPAIRKVLDFIRAFIAKYREAGPSERKVLVKDLFTSDAFQILLIAFAVLVTFGYLLYVLIS